MDSLGQDFERAQAALARAAGLLEQSRRLRETLARNVESSTRTRDAVAVELASMRERDALVRASYVERFARLC